MSQIKDHLKFEGINLTLTYDFYPGEPEVRYDSNMTGTPASPPEFHDLRVYVQDTDITDLLSDDKIDEIIVKLATS